MTHPQTRRGFLTRSACAALAAAAGNWIGSSPANAIEAFQRSGQPRFLLGLAAYSFRDFFKDSNHKQSKPAAGARQIDMFQFVDYCAEQGCDGAEVTSYYFPKDLSDDYLLRLKRHAFLRGVAISGTAIGNTFTHPAGAKRDAEIALTKQWIDRAAVLGAPHIRVFAGNLQQGMSKEEAKKLTIAALEECGDHAARKGVFLGLENHGGIVAEASDLLDIVRAVKCPSIGINLDTGNFHTADPYGDLEKCAPYSVNVQIKVEIQKKGEPKGWADLPRLVKILRDTRYQGFVTLEYEAAEDPWAAVPRHLSAMGKLLRAV